MTLDTCQHFRVTGRRRRHIHHLQPALLRQLFGIATLPERAPPRIRVAKQQCSGFVAGTAGLTAGRFKTGQRFIHCLVKSMLLATDDWKIDKGSIPSAPLRSLSIMSSITC
ncbi:MAG: hypothetical protein R3E95_18030 [Thiolinea sp.]